MSLIGVYRLKQQVREFAQNAVLAAVKEVVHAVHCGIALRNFQAPLPLSFDDIVCWHVVGIEGGLNAVACKALLFSVVVGH